MAERRRGINCESHESGRRARYIPLVYSELSRSVVRRLLCSSAALESFRGNGLILRNFLLVAASLIPSDGTMLYAHPYAQRHVSIRRLENCFPCVTPIGLFYIDRSELTSLMSEHGALD